MNKLCARHFLSTTDTAVNKMDKVPALLRVTFQFRETNNYVTCQVIISEDRYEDEYSKIRDILFWIRW